MRRCLATQIGKNFKTRVQTVQSGTASVIHSRSKKERRFSRFSAFSAFNFHFLTVKTAKIPVFERSDALLSHSRKYQK